MSIKQAKELYSKLLVDERFRRQIERASNDHERYQILHNAGFSCTSLELKIAKNELLQSLRSTYLTDCELSPMEQDDIVGGSLSQSWIAGGSLSESWFDHIDRYLFKEKD